jgi:anti-sigma factor RsiW
MNRFIGNQDKHRECWELLPWYANERLPLKDVQRIEAHLRECTPCRMELTEQRALRDAIRAEDAVVLAPQASFQKLMQRIDSDDQRRPVNEPASRMHRPARAPRWLAFAAGVQAFAIAALLGTVWWQSEQIRTAPRFSTLTAPSSAPEGPVIRIVFGEQVTVGEINDLLRSLQAHIVAGPNSAGVYTLQLGDPKHDSSDIEEIAAQLRTDPRVIFSEPAIAEITAK